VDALYFRVSSERQTTQNQFDDLLHVAENDGLQWWQRLGMRLAEKARSVAMSLAEKARSLRRSREQERLPEPEPEREGDYDDRGIDL
jgi:hypothetical protein